MTPILTETERVKLVATIAAKRLEGGYLPDAIQWAAELVNAVEADVAKRREPVSPPNQAKPRTVEDWIRDNGRSPWKALTFWHWNMPQDFSTKSLLPQSIFNALTGEDYTHNDGVSTYYETREEAIADLRQALLSLKLIEE